MKLLSNYNEYINEFKILEALRTFPLFLSKRLREMLSNIDHEIAQELLSKHSDLDTRVKQTFLDIHPSKLDAITFIRPNKVVDILGWDIKDDEELNTLSDNFDVDTLKNMNDDAGVYNQQRGETKWGRFINAAFPNKFQLSISGGQNKSDIESFVNLYKALYARETKFAMLHIIEGDDISHFYNANHYADENRGTLGDSCMKWKDEDFFDIYTTNPNVVKQIVMFGNARKTVIKARALLWTLSQPTERTFMDRVYTNDFSDEQIFIDFAKSNNWLYKSRQGMGSDIHTTDPATDVSSHLTLVTQLRESEYRNYPYCDTMAYYNPHTGKLGNKKRPVNAKYELTGTDGDYCNVSGYEEVPEYVFSKYHNQDINKHYARYCKFGDDWVNSDEAIRVYNSGGGENYAVPGHPDIVQSRFVKRNGNTYNRHFPKSKCVWSEYLNTWVFRWRREIVMLDLDRKTVGLIHTKTKRNDFIEINGELWLKSLTRNERLIGDVAPKVVRPVNAPRGWHNKIEHIDEEGNIFERGLYMGKQN